jgi:Chemotaxis protein histidine kinase and related kinases
MDPEVLRRKAVEKGLMDEEQAARLDERECYEIVFRPASPRPARYRISPAAASAWTS